MACRSGCPKRRAEFVAPGARQILQMFRVVSPKSDVLFSLMKQARQGGSPRARTEHSDLHGSRVGGRRLSVEKNWFLDISNGSAIELSYGPFPLTPTLSPRRGRT